MMDRIRAVLPEKLDEGQDEDFGEVDWERARETIRKLNGLLADSDSDALDVFRQSESLLKAALGSFFPGVKTPIGGWDLEGAHRALRSACEEIPHLRDVQSQSVETGD